MAEWRIEPLARDHDRQNFACGHESLDDFLKTRAGQHQRKRMSRTYVAVRPDERRVFGYYSLAVQHIEPGDLPPATAKKLPRHPVPAALLARLAVDSSAQGRGLGAVLVRNALTRCLTLADQVGLFAVVVDAIDDPAADFYARIGFLPLGGGARRLFLPIETLEKGLGKGR
jgi:GNAT superfamily N-acetyltransferase